ncbi:MAG: hypothetical protein AAFX05_14165 [Planctomycetota bacterium]
MPERRTWVSNRLMLRTVLLAMVAPLIAGCVGHTVYNTEPEQYLRELAVEGHDDATFDLAIVEFDDHGVFWKIEQLEDTIDLIERRNAESERGILVLPYVHGWQNNADPDRTSGNLVSFREQLGNIARNLAAGDGTTPDRVVGVYLGWRGRTSYVPLHEQATFWDRRSTAERVVSLNMQEALLRITNTARSRPDSKCLVTGHSMGGMIVGKTLSPALTTLLLSNDGQGVPMPVDLIILLNPALDALASWQFIDFLKRSNAMLELRRSSGEFVAAPGPLIVSITSEADSATKTAYPFGRTVSSLFTAFRNDHDAGVPSQKHLARHAEGHVEYLVSHRARVEDGEVILERIPGAYNDTPFWVIQVTRDISRDHSDTRNPVLGRLIAQIVDLNQIYETDVQTWMTTPR